MWRSWRDAVGPKVRDDFIRYVELANEAARLMGQLPNIYFQEQNEIQLTINDII